MMCAVLLQMTEVRPEGGVFGGVEMFAVVALETAGVEGSFSEDAFLSDLDWEMPEKLREFKIRLIGETGGRMEGT